MKRILITGSREWDDYPAMKAALKTAWLDLSGPPTQTERVLLISGHAPGADKMAEDIWSVNVDPNWIERHPAKDFPHPLKRNDHMVSLGADLCLAFPTICHKVCKGRPAMHWSHGTDYTIKKARAAGIDTRIIVP